VKALQSLLTGLVMLLTLAAWTASAAAADKASVTLNLKDATIKSLIQTVSQVTGKNFIVDPRVNGKVTVISSSPMDPDSLYQTFLSVLAVAGFATIPDGAVIKIVPDSSARDQSTELARAGVPRDQIVTQVFALQNASAAQLVPILRPLVPQWGHLAAYAPSNMLIITDRAANVHRLAGIIQQIDLDHQEQVVIVPLKYAAVGDVVQVLQDLAQQAQKRDPTAQPPAVVADTRTNSVVIGGTQSDIDKVKQVIARLDTPSEGGSGGGSTQVIYLHYASAKKLAPILKGYAQEAKDSDLSSDSDSSSSSQTNTNTAAKAAAAARAAISQHGSSSGGNTHISVIADSDTNALVVTAPPKLMQMVKNVIAKLDIRRAQVLVDGIIAEVSANTSSELGLDSVIYNPNSIASANILNPNTLSTLQNAATSVGTVGTGTTTNSLAAAAAGLLGQGVNAAAGALSSGGTSFLLLLKALQGDSNNNILSTPSLVTMDNEKAKIEVAQDVPTLTGSFSNTGAGSGNNGAVNPFQTFQNQTVGLTLSLTPTINAGNTIKLKLALKNSSISSGQAGTASLITNKRTISDTVTVGSGQILVIGGLIDNQLNDTHSGVPFLSSIPIIGSLFSYRSETDARRNLMVFIHPVVLRESRDVNYYTRLKYGEMRSAQVSASGGSAPMTGARRPILYPWKEYKARHRGEPGTATTSPAPAPASSSAGAPTASPAPASSAASGPAH
jgi:general secretion pathway protein D